MRLFALFLIVIPNLFLAASTEMIQKELELFNLPATSWRVEEDSDMVDVAIIGAGQAGISIAHALALDGISNVKIFDAADEGEEGPWLTTARMLTLRSSKTLRGPAQLPHLTFRAWFEELYGKSAWDEMNKIPTDAWGRYLLWLKENTGVHVTNNKKLVSINPNVDDSLTLLFEDQSTVKCRKVVLATGRMGFGGAEVPNCCLSLPKQFWAHASERLTSEFFKNKRIAVVGVGASGFDAAAFALEAGAKTVDMIMRRDVLPVVNHGSQFAYPGFLRGFYSLSDRERHDFTVKVLEEGIPPPQESIERLKPFSNFTLLDSCTIAETRVVGKFVELETNKGKRTYDFILAATGYAVDVAKTVELSTISDKILLWQDRLADILPKFGRFAYLGQHFEFMEKVPGEASYLRNIHCFNFGALMSHGRISSELDGLHIGIARLVDGIIIDLFLQDTCRNGGPTPNECPGTCQIGLCSPFSLQSGDE